VIRVEGINGDQGGEIMMEMEANFRIVTPVFMSGSERSQAELREASIKGMLRFWWRALSLGKLKSIEEVKKREALIFGSSETGQSNVQLMLSLPENIETIEKGRILEYDGGGVIGPGARYLGYGVIEAFGSAKKRTKAGEVIRPCLKAPVNGVLRLLFKRGTSEEDIKMVEVALIAMSLFGGIGSRSRKGYGSFNLLELRHNDEALFSAPVDIQDLKAKIMNLFKKYEIIAYDGRPEYTSYSTETRIDIIETGKDPLRLLNSVGEAMQMYRSWGKDNKVNGKDAEKNFKDDHDLARQAIGQKVNKHPRRVVFGLPHNYFFSSIREKVDVSPERQERRASPLFIHIQGLQNGQFAAVTTIMPADFLPRNERIVIGESTVSTFVDFSVLHEFLDGKDGHGRNRFPMGDQVIGPAAQTEVI
jgi:CRISPR-associated protein Cmr1